MKRGTGMPQKQTAGFWGGCGVFIMMSEFMRYGIGMRNLRFILWKGECEVPGWA